MKKIVFCAILCLCTVVANAQIMRAEELENYAKEKFGDKWNEAAEGLSKELQLDKNNSLTYTQVIDCGEKTKEQIYVILNYWFTASFNDANSVIKLNDKDAGCIIAQGYVANVARHVGGMTAYNISIKPIIKVDIKDKRVRVTYTIQGYEAVKAVGGGILGAMGGTPPSMVSEIWAIDTCYPFVEKDKHKKTSSKALIMTHAYSNVIMDKIEETVKNGLVGNETEDW